MVDRTDWELARRIFLFAESEEEVRRRAELVGLSRPKTYEFCVVLGDNTIDEEVAEALLLSGCDDGAIVRRGLCTHIRFSREAESLEEAMRSAIADIHKAKCVVPKSVEIEVIDLVEIMVSNDDVV